MTVTLPIDFADTVAAVVATMPASHVRAFAAAVNPHGTWSEAFTAPAAGAVASPGYRESALALLAAWRLQPALSGSGIAVAVLAALAARDSERGREVVDVVATGPSSPHVSVRPTRAVMLELIAQARRDLLFVSFAAYRVSGVAAALAVAAERGVTIRMVLETAEASAGALRFDGAHAFEAVRSHLQFYVWPAERRPPGVNAALHAKAVVADDRAAFVSSANLTESALDHNLELGLLVRGGPVPARIREHFRALIGSGVLRLT
jgi:phosphatidylserine/phosphatidylglycerophosphate/cardiolipin synthase-like enzyme